MCALVWMISRFGFLSCVFLKNKNLIVFILILINCFFWIADIRHSVKSTLVKQLDQNGDLFVATVNLLTAATHYQVCFNRVYFLYLST